MSVKRPFCAEPHSKHSKMSATGCILKGSASAPYVCLVSNLHRLCCCITSMCVSSHVWVGILLNFAELKIDNYEIF